MVRILAPLLCSNKCGSCCTMMAVSDVESRNSGKYFCDGSYVLLVVNHPEMVAETVFCDEIVLRFTKNVAVYDGVDLRTVRI